MRRDWGSVAAVDTAPAVLVVEDEPALAQSVQYTLEQECFRVLIAGDHPTLRELLPLQDFGESRREEAHDKHIDDRPIASDRDPNRDSADPSFPGRRRASRPNSRGSSSRNREPSGTRADLGC